MNRGTLPIIARLLSLQTPSRLAPGGARVIADITDPSPLASLVRELNETMLSRSLMFESGGGSSLTLEVAGRRVLRVTGVSGLEGAERCLAASALEDEYKDELIKLFQAVATPRHELRVTTGPAEHESEGLSVGLPVALLADLCLIELNETAPPEVDAENEADFSDEDGEPAEARVGTEAPLGTGFLSRFAHEFGPDLMAWLVVGSEDDGLTYGPEELTSHLQGFLADEADELGSQLDQLSQSTTAPTCVVLGAKLTEGHSILCIRDSGGILLGVIDGDGSKNLLRAWSAARA